MDFFNIEQAASRLGMRQEGVLALCQSGWFGRKLANTWLITKIEINHYTAGRRADANELPALYDADAMIKDLKISRSRFYRLVAQEKILGLRFGKRGGHPNMVFTQEQLTDARQAVAGIDGMGKRDVPEDQYIEERDDGRFYVLGTINDNRWVQEDKGFEERNYKSRMVARAKAREAHGQPPIYKKGDRIPYGDQEFIFLKDVTPIDGRAHVQLGDSQVFVRVKELIDLEDQDVQDKKLVTVYKDGLWPSSKGESDGENAEDSSE